MIFYVFIFCIVDGFWVTSFFRRLDFHFQCTQYSKIYNNWSFYPLLGIIMEDNTATSCTWDASKCPNKKTEARTYMTNFLTYSVMLTNSCTEWKQWSDRGVKQIMLWGGNVKQEKVFFFSSFLRLFWTPGSQLKQTSPIVLFTFLFPELVPYASFPMTSRLSWKLWLDGKVRTTIYDSIIAIHHTQQHCAVWSQQWLIQTHMSHYFLTTLQESTQNSLDCWMKNTLVLYTLTSLFLRLSICRVYKSSSNQQSSITTSVFPLLALCLAFHSAVSRTHPQTLSHSFSACQCKQKHTSPQGQSRCFPPFLQLQSAAKN